MRPTLEVLETRLLLTHPVPLPQIEQEPNDTPETANVIRLDTEAADHDPAVGRAGHVWGELNLECALFCLGPRQVPPDQDWFKFEAPAERRLNLSVVGDRLAGVGISLVQHGRELASDTNSSDGFSIEQGSGDGGTFHVRLFVAAFEQIVSQRLGCLRPDTNQRLECFGHIPYILKVHVTAPQFVEHEPNDTMQQANPIVLRDWLLLEKTQPTLADPPAVPVCQRPCGMGQHGLIDGNLRDDQGGSDVDFFWFPSDAERKIVVALEGPALKDGVLPRLLDAHGTELAVAQAHDRNGDGVNDLAVLEYFTRTEGKFFVQVRPGSDSMETARPITA